MPNYASLTYDKAEMIDKKIKFSILIMIRNTITMIFIPANDNNIHKYDINSKKKRSTNEKVTGL